MSRQKVQYNMIHCCNILQRKDFLPVNSMQCHALHLNCDVINVTSPQLSVSLPQSISIECSSCSTR